MLVGCAVVLCLATAVRADWNLEDPYKMHYPQLPDLETGLDVRATIPKVLADDFKCTQTGPITDIHIWGSWLNDYFPKEATGTTQDPGNVVFRLSLHLDVPAGPGGTDFSHPGEEIWSAVFQPGQFVWRGWATRTEGFFDPNVPASQNPIIGFDTQVIQYNFFLKPEPNNPLPRQEEGKIYWLDVMAMVPQDPDAIFGWKSAVRPTGDLPPHFGDDAVYGHVEMLPDGGGVQLLNDWLPLKYPVGHPFEGQSMDLAFVITPEPATMALVGLGAAGLLARRRRR
jgi:hypothetical protein